MALLLMAVLGGCSYPLYSIAAAYTNDWIEPEHVNAAASQLVTLYGIGAMVGPFVAAGMMIVVGPKGFFWAAIVLHGLLAAFFVYRLRAWRAPLAKRPWSEVSLPARAFFVPATVVAMGRRYRDKRAPDASIIVGSPRSRASKSGVDINALHRSKRPTAYAQKSSAGLPLTCWITPHSVHNRSHNAL